MTHDDVYDLLDSHAIHYEKYEHSPAVTTEEADKVIPLFDAVRTKNLFLRNSNGKCHFLVSIRSDKKIDLKKLSDLLGKGKLGFASTDRLERFLSVAPGALSLLSIFCDQKNSVELIVDEEVWNSDSILCHPLINTITLIVDMKRLRELIISYDHPPLLLKI